LPCQIEKIGWTQYYGKVLVDGQPGSGHKKSAEGH